ncbi:MAG TPA: twin-arginine translocase TatA/TatE family subunit [Pyrinomonadaceae bacterium]|jgi:sec-independent protein translocase protein TatB|nr:twin-arginine translocase TatA/TatE family subunit [Pyrinomonadaceae bacterium]
MFLAIFEFLGTSELLIILIAALILFGPRKLPQLSRQLGKSLGEFKRASEDFKRTWEKEVNMEKLEEEGRMARAMLQDDQSTIADTSERRSALEAASAETAVLEDRWTPTETLQPTVARSSSNDAGEQTAALATETAATPETSSKRDWL